MRDDAGGPRWAEARPRTWRNQNLGNVEAWTRDNWLTLVFDFRRRAELRLFDPADLVEFVSAWARVEHDIELARIRGPPTVEPSQGERDQGD